MDELEMLRKQKLAALQQQQEEQQQEEQKLQQQMEQLEEAVKAHLTREAVSRYTTLKAAHPEKALQLLLVLAQAFQRQPNATVSDEQLKQILAKITPKERATKIRRV